MPFSAGNWSVGSYKLPELSLTEKFGGNRSSLKENIAPIQSKVQAPVLIGPRQPSSNPKILGDADYTPSGGGNGGGGGGGTPTGDSEDTRMKEVDSIYEDIMNYIGKQRNNLNASKSQLLTLAQKPYEAMMPKVRETAQQGVDTLKGYITDVGMEGENALNSARRLHNELSTRNQQAFGSSELSSAGQASSELLNRDTYKQFGDVRQQVSTQVRTLENEIGRVQRERDVQLNELETQKQQALAQAELKFRDSVSQLDQYEAQTRSSKKVDKINALKEYRAEVQDTNRYFREIQSQIATNSAYNEQRLTSDYNNLLNSLNTTTSQAGQGVDEMGNQIGMAQDQMAYDQALGMGGAEQNPLITGYRKPLEEDPYSQYTA